MAKSVATQLRELRENCPNREQHTPCPSGYLDWHAWAKRMDHTHRQVRCEGCELFLIWVPKRKRSDHQLATESPGG